MIPAKRTAVPNPRASARASSSALWNSVDQVQCRRWLPGMYLLERFQQQKKRFLGSEASDKQVDRFGRRRYVVLPLQESRVRVVVMAQCNSLTGLEYPIDRCLVLNHMLAAAHAIRQEAVALGKEPVFQPSLDQRLSLVVDRGIAANRPSLSGQHGRKEHKPALRPAVAWKHDHRGIGSQHLEEQLPVQQEPGNVVVAPGKQQLVRVVVVTQVDSAERRLPRCSFHKLKEPDLVIVFDSQRMQLLKNRSLVSGPEDVVEHIDGGAVPG